MIVDCAHYKDGRRQNTEPLSIDEAADCRHDPGGGFVWVGVVEPTPDEMQSLAQRFDLHPLAVEDANNAHQRPKLEDYEHGAFFLVLRTAYYDQAREVVEFGEVHVFIGPGYVVTVRHGKGDLHEARLRLEARPDLIAAGPASVVWAVLDKVVDDYEPVAHGIEDDVEETETSVFTPGEDPTERIYFLRREVIEFYRAVHPLLAPLEALESGAFPNMPALLRQYFRDVADHVRRVNDEVLQQRELLFGVLQANMAVISVDQNEVVRKVSGWAAIITVPTLIASVYGMNFEHMPELAWKLGYPLALGAMAMSAFLLYRMFRRSGWL